MFAVIFCLALSVVSISSSAQKVKLDVYYESLCPDSKSLMVNQLAPSWDVMSQLVDLRLIPFGKASFKAKSDQGWTFRCQHGARECAGNIFHACGIKYSPDTNKTVTYTTCLMNSPTDPSKCAKKAGLDYQPIHNCSLGTEGENLLHEHGVETLGLSPRMTFVPWLVFNQEWDYDNQWKGLRNLKSLLCKDMNLQNGTSLCT